MNVVRLAELRDTPLSVDEVLAAVADPGAGGIALFVGAVRDHDGAREVTRLSYSAHPSAAAELRIVAEKVAADFDVRALAAVHRVGNWTWATSPWWWPSPARTAPRRSRPAAP